MNCGFNIEIFLVLLRIRAVQCLPSEMFTSVDQQKQLSGMKEYMICYVNALVFLETIVIDHIWTFICTNSFYKPSFEEKTKFYGTEILNKRQYEIENCFWVY